MRKVKSVRKVNRVKLAAKIVLGVGIPSLVLSMSSLFGTLASERNALAVLPACVGLTMLYVSLSHVADSVARLTGSTTHHAYAMAIALDVGIVTCELVGMTGQAGMIPGMTLTGCTVTSMLLNVYAFTR